MSSATLETQTGVDHAGANRPTLLIVDDEPGIREAYRRVLAADRGLEVVPSPRRPRWTPQLGKYRLLLAESGEQAVELVSAESKAGRKIHGGFFDMRMPGIDGLETIRQVLAIDPNMHCVIVTAHQDRSLNDIGSIFGKDRSDRWDYLDKPLSSNEIKQKARHLVAAWQQRQRQDLQTQALSARASALGQELQEARDRLENSWAALERSVGKLSEANERLSSEKKARERAENELNLAQKLEVVGRLAAGIAHEINTPIQFIGDNASFLESAVESYQGVINQLTPLVAAAKTFVDTADLVDAVEKSVEEADLDFLNEQVPQAIEQILDGVARVAKIVGAMKDFSHPGLRKGSWRGC